MGKILSLPERSAHFIKRAKEIYGDIYDYSQVKYFDAAHKVKIICKSHGPFFVRPGNHINFHRCGCRICGWERTGISNKRTQREFLEESRKIHKNTYDYSLAEYNGEAEKVKIICKKHGIFLVEPRSHLKGSGCAKCAMKRIGEELALTNSEFISRARKKHGNKFNYELCRYKNAKCHVKIECPKHGIFEQNPFCHLKGNGCPRCSKENGFHHGFKRENFIKLCKKKKRIPRFYIIKLYKDKEIFIKIGITGKEISRRCNEIPYSYKTIKEVFGSAGFVWDLERLMKKLCKRFKYHPNIKFGGYTECYKKSAKKQILVFLEEQLVLNPPK